MNNFFKSFFASLLAFFVYSIITVVLGVVLITVVVISLSSKGALEIKSGTILHITLSETISDRVSDDILDRFSLSTLSSTKTLGLNDILASLATAKTDDNIKGIYLDLGLVDTGFSTLDDIRSALLDFKESGKFIYCHADSFTQKAYFVSTASDSINLTPAGDLDLKGLSVQVFYYKNALAKLGLEPQIIRHGKFKSAVEPYILDEMSEENRTQLNSYVSAVWNDSVAKIGKARNIAPSKLNAWADSLSVTTAEKALDYKLIDGLKYSDEVYSDLASLTSSASVNDLKFIELPQYIAHANTSIAAKVSENEIAVIYALGAMEMGSGSATTIGSAGLGEAIRTARDNDKVKAIVLRVNSPGGDALAAEIILREVKRAHEKKPVIVSMGEYAASGGYYIACAADKIIAGNDTLTGSIGVFGMYFSAEKLLGDKLGVTVNAVNTNRNSDIGTITRPMSAEEQKYKQAQIEDIYRKFVAHVAEGRNMSADKVDSIGQGRIWSGADALKIGLVDEIGGLDYAIKKAAEIAEITDYRIVNLPVPKNAFEQFTDNFSSSVRNKIAAETAGTEYVYYEKLKELLEIRGIQARMPYLLEIY